MDRRIAIGVAALAAILAGVVFYIRSNPNPAAAIRRERAQEEVALAARAAEAFATLSMAPLQEQQSPGDIAALLRRGYISGALPDGSGSMDDLIDHLSEFIYYRFCQADPAAYRTWRADHGYGISSWAHMTEFWMMDEDYRAITGNPVTPELTSAEAFDAIWRADADPTRNWAGPATGMSSETRGIVLSIFMYARGGMTPRPAGDSAAGGFEQDLWDARSMSGHSRWHG